MENSKRIFVFNDCPLRSFRKSIVIRELTGQNIPIKRFFCHRQETTGDYWHLKSMNCVAKRLCTPRTHSHDQMSQDSFSNHIVSPSLSPSSPPTLIPKTCIEKLPKINDFFSNIINIGRNEKLLALKGAPFIYEKRFICTWIFSIIFYIYKNSLIYLIVQTKWMSLHDDDAMNSKREKTLICT